MKLTTNCRRPTLRASELYGVAGVDFLRDVRDRLTQVTELHVSRRWRENGAYCIEFFEIEVPVEIELDGDEIADVRRAGAIDAEIDRDTYRADVRYVMERIVGPGGEPGWSVVRFRCLVVCL